MLSSANYGHESESLLVQVYQGIYQLNIHLLSEQYLPELSWTAYY